MDPVTVSTPLAGFIAGLVTSIHCVGMCGPLACAILPRNRPGPAANGGLSHTSSIALYHGARIGSYTGVGLLAGALGGAVASLFSFGVAKALPWAFVALFVVFLLGWEKRIPKIPYLSGLFFRFRMRASQMKRPVLAVLLGVFTPFLPCAPLYLMFGVALLTGSALAGGAMMAAFALGTVAPMWLLQSQFLRWQGRLSPTTMSRIQKGLAVASILLISWRAFSMGEASPEALTIPSCCPL
jgi:uncharacterized protein